jgi:hypothetical protein
MGTKSKKEERQQADSSGSGQKAGSQPGDGDWNKGGKSASSGGRTKGGGQPGGGQSGGQGGK